MGIPPASRDVARSAETRPPSDLPPSLLREAVFCTQSRNLVFPFTQPRLNLPLLYLSIYLSLSLSLSRGRLEKYEFTSEKYECRKTDLPDELCVSNLSVC